MLYLNSIVSRMKKSPKLKSRKMMLVHAWSGMNRANYCNIIISKQKITSESTYPGIIVFHYAYIVQLGRASKSKSMKPLMDVFLPALALYSILPSSHVHRRKRPFADARGASHVHCVRFACHGERGCCSGERLDFFDKALKRVRCSIKVDLSR